MKLNNTRDNNIKDSSVTVQKNMLGQAANIQADRTVLTCHPKVIRLFTPLPPQSIPVPVTIPSCSIGTWQLIMHLVYFCTGFNEAVCANCFCRVAHTKGFLFWVPWGGEFAAVVVANEEQLTLSSSYSFCVEKYQRFNQLCQKRCCGSTN